MARHHPTEEMLLDYATGAQCAPASLLIACHLTFCPQCRKGTAFYDRLGGALLESAPPQPVMKRACPDPPELASGPAVRHSGIVADDPILPRPLRRQVGCSAAELPWRRIIPGLFEVPLHLGPPEADAKLMRIRAGKCVPRHTHEGVEVTLVLTGAFSDPGGHYGRGDVSIADARVDHRPCADPGEDCICLAVTDAPLRLTGKLGRVLSLLGVN